MRVDSALYAGYRIPPYYDSLIGKLIVHRAQPQRMPDAAAGGRWANSWSTGSKPPFRCSSALVREPDIINGDYDIHWLEKYPRQRPMPDDDDHAADSASRPMPPGFFRWRRAPRTTRFTGSSRKSAACLPLEDFHVPRSLEEMRAPAVVRVRVDTAFAEVIAACAASAPGRNTTWINSRIRSLYNQLHRMGCCHAIECWRAGELVGGLYGVRIGAAFFGESMFSRVPNASKVALVHLVARLKAGGFKLLDAQFMTPHLARFGARTIERDRYRKLLDRRSRQMPIFLRSPEISIPNAC